MDYRVVALLPLLTFVPSAVHAGQFNPLQLQNAQYSVRIERPLLNPVLTNRLARSAMAARKAIAAQKKSPNKRQIVLEFPVVEGIPLPRPRPDRHGRLVANEQSALSILEMTRQSELEVDYDDVDD